jgi:uncharacterized protein (UPF0332 family)
MQAIEFLENAKDESVKDGEVHVRNSVSRAYYAAFHESLKLNKTIADHAGMRQNVGVHEQLISKLTNCPASENHHLKIRAIGYILSDSKKFRVLADYRLENAMNPTQATDQIARAERIFEKIAEVEQLLNQTHS